MFKQRINYEYLKQGKEALFLFRANYLKKKGFVENPKKILIVNPCIMGDFIASVLAIRYFVKNKDAEVDLIVSPTMKPLAERVKGIRKVFVAKSIYSRKIEDLGNIDQKFDEYDSIIVMRIGKDAYEIIKKIKARQIKSSFWHFVGYGIYLAKNADKKIKIKQWREINFDILGEKYKDIKFEDIFDFNISDYKKIKKLPEMRTKDKKVIIHTGSGWPVKLWDNEKWVKFLRRANSLGKFKFIFVGGNDEEKDFKEISSKLNFKIYSLIGKVDTKDLMLVLRTSDYFVGIDSGPRNMAHLADLRSVSLLGPGPRQFMPLKNEDIIIDKSNCKCTALYCYKKETCMQKISVEEVFEAFKRIIKESKKV